VHLDEREEAVARDVQRAVRLQVHAGGEAHEVAQHLVNGLEPADIGTEGTVEVDDVVSEDLEEEVCITGLVGGLLRLDQRRIPPGDRGHLLGDQRLPSDRSALVQQCPTGHRDHQHRDRGRACRGREPFR
jgi:hypothetical protein